MKTITRDELIALLGEGVHTAFRKAGRSWRADEIHKQIDLMDDAEWKSIVTFVADGIIFSTTGGFQIQDDRQNADIGQ